MIELSQDIGHRLRLHKLAATGVQITIKNGDLSYRQYQAPLAFATQSPQEISLKGKELFSRNYNWAVPVRAVTIRHQPRSTRVSTPNISVFRFRTCPAEGTPGGYD